MKPGIDPAGLVRGQVRALRAYGVDLAACRHQLDQNEARFEPPPALKRQVARALRGARWARYPEPHAGALRRDLGELCSWPVDGVLVGNGSDELLDVCLSALVTPGGEVLGCDPTFSMYRILVAKAGGVARFLPPAADLRLPFAALMAEVERDARRPLLLCTPNNPTGDALPPEAVDQLAARYEGPILLDNAYGEFCRYDYRPLLERHPHLILLRTFSKAWAVAGLRIGYLLADPRLVAELLKVKLPYNVGTPAILAGRAMLAAAPAVRRRIAVVVARRAQWHFMLQSAGLQVLPSEANFLLVRCAGAAAATALRDGLAARGIRVRNVGGYPGLAGALRISVGSGAALRATRQALAELLPATSAVAGDATLSPVAAATSIPIAAAAASAAGAGSSPATPPPAVAAAAAVSPVSPVSPMGTARRGAVERATGETRVRLALDLDGGMRRIAVPNGFFGHMLQALATHGGLGLDLEAAGDLHVDLHHTVEDVGIAFGQALDGALGGRHGLVRFGTAYAPLDEALARAVVDLSGRGFLSYTAPRDIAAAWVTAEFPLTLVADFFQAVADRGRLTLHLDILAARNGHHAAEAAFKAVALALRQAVALRRSPASAAAAPDVPSTKGTLTA